MPSTYVKPVYILLSGCHLYTGLSRYRQTRTIVQKVSCCACCQCIQLESSLLLLSCTLTLQSGSSPHTRSHGWSIHRKIFKCAHFKIYSKWSVQTKSIHTHVHNAVTLVWGSLRLTPITGKRVNNIQPILVISPATNFNKEFNMLCYKLRLDYLAQLMSWHIPYSVDREIFAVKIISILNFHVKNISPPNSSTM